MLRFIMSFFGGIFSVICLMLLAPVLAKVAPLFGSREIFLAALLGIILVIVAHRGQSLIAGALAGFGIFIQTIGLEPVKYSKRFTFDQAFLSSGIDLIVIQYHFHPNFGKEIYNIFRTTVEFGVAFLTSEPLGFKNGYSLQPDLVKGFLHFIQLEGFYDGFDFFHGLSIKSPVKGWLVNA